ncbi:MAG TPA: biotin-dependent carboxyltransferase family protein [Bryobacteraceae bacterium]|nr:biotin-dependent carboxyltransferase family protein [Bryobacteraceae bacterium]
MKTLIVVTPGLLTTVQDLGRYGYGAIGVSPSGAADPLALRVGNVLVGNPEGAPALEMTLLGGSFDFSQGAVVVLTGADFGAAIDGVPVEGWTAHRVPPGGRLAAGMSRGGARCYLCIAGGLDVARVLGSASTHVRSGLGGRPLKKGDVFRIGDTRAPAPSPAPPLRIEYRKVLRATRGPQAEWFSSDLCAGAYRVTEQADRMGLRLEGPALRALKERSMVTEGVPLGAVQVPPGGQPIILFVEQQTTGGYPKVANVIAADLPSVAQLRPRDEIRFEWVSPEEARRLLLEQEALIRNAAH